MILGKFSWCIRGFAEGVTWGEYVLAPMACSFAGYSPRGQGVVRDWGYWACRLRGRGQLVLPPVGRCLRPGIVDEVGGAVRRQIAIGIVAEGGRPRGAVLVEAVRRIRPAHIIGLAVGVEIVVQRAADDLARRVVAEVQVHIAAAAAERVAERLQPRGGVVGIAAGIAARPAKSAAPALVVVHHVDEAGRPLRCHTQPIQPVIAIAEALPIRVADAEMMTIILSPRL